MTQLPRWRQLGAGAHPEASPRADIRVYVGWIPILPGDANPKVAGLLVDARAKHFWDGDRELGREVARILAGAPSPLGHLPRVRAGRDLGDRPDAAGSPVISESGDLQRALDPYLEMS